MPKNKNDRYVIYPTCSLVDGSRDGDGYLKTDDPHSEPKYQSCLDCPRWLSCLNKSKSMEMIKGK